MTRSVHFLISYNKLSIVCCISSQQAKSVIPYSSADAKMHPDQGSSPKKEVGGRMKQDLDKDFKTI